MNEVHLRQGTIRYRDVGAGEPLLFLHGIGVNGNLWRKVTPRLSKDFRCIVPDWPLGSHTVPMSEEADFSLPGLARLTVDFMDAIGLEQATLVGNDSGGAISQQVAVDDPDRVARMVLNSSELYERFLPPFFKPLQLSARVPWLMTAGNQLMRFRRMQGPMGFGISLKNGLPERAVMDSYVRPGLESAGVRRDLRKFLLAVDPRYTLEAAEMLRNFDKPVLLLWGDDDKLFPIDYPRRFAAALPNARLEIVRDSRTFAPEDQPEAVVDAIAAFVREPVRVES